MKINKIVELNWKQAYEQKIFNKTPLKDLLVRTNFEKLPNISDCLLNLFSEFLLNTNQIIYPQFYYHFYKRLPKLKDKH